MAEAVENEPLWRSSVSLSWPGLRQPGSIEMELASCHCPAPRCPAPNPRPRPTAAASRRVARRPIRARNRFQLALEVLQFPNGFRPRPVWCPAAACSGVGFGFDLVARFRLAGDVIEAHAPRRLDPRPDGAG